MPNRVIIVGSDIDVPISVDPAVGIRVNNYVWNHITGLWEEAPAVVTTRIMRAAGQVAAGAHKLYWISCNPSAGNSEWKLTDATAGGAFVVLEHFHTTRESHNTNLIPPMNFTTGIYLETFVAMTSMTFGYI